MQPRPDRLRALQDLMDLLKSLEESVDAIVVEGPRDEEALRRLGVQGSIMLRSRVGLSDEDLIDEIMASSEKVLIMTDFDEEGREMNRRLTLTLERRGVKVDIGLRRAVGRLMAVLGVYAVEDLDNVGARLSESAF